MKYLPLYIMLNLQKFRGGGLTALLLRNSVGSLGLRILSIVLELSIVTILARSLGPDGYGIYIFVYSLMRICAVPAQAGLPTLIVREVAAYQQRMQWPYLKGIVIRSNQAVLAFSAVIGLFAAAMVLVKSLFDPVNYISVYFWAFALMPLFALGSIRGAMLRGLGRVILGQLPENIFRPLFFLALIVIYFVFSGEFEPALAMALHCAAALAAFLLGTYFLLKFLPPEIKPTSAQFESKRWISSAIPLSLVMGMTTFLNQVSLLTMGFFRSLNEVGVFGVAVQLSMVSAIPLAVANIAVAPHISKLFVQNETEKLQLIATTSARILFLALLGIFSAFLLFGKFAIGLSFGSKYLGAYTPLIILAGAYCIGSVSGTAMIYLNMTRNEHGVLRSLAITATISVILNFLLVPKYGATGAAIAMGIGIICLNLFLALSVKQRLNLAAFPFMRRKR